jgi:DNA repair exonuclease SbcCD ATPase subunit
MQDFAKLPMSIIGNIIAVLALAYKSLYDVYFNPRRFRTDLAKGVESVKALEDKNKRTSSSTTIAFAVTAISFALLVGADLVKSDDSKTDKETEVKQSLDDMQKSLSNNDRRLKKIEDTLWPPQNPGTHGNPNPPPYDPAGMQASLDKMEKDIADLRSQDTRLEAKIERVIRALNKLSHEVHEYKETVDKLQQIHAAPAG